MTTAELMTAKDVADRLGISENQVKRRTVSERWPCVRFSARTIRYRLEHVEQIIAMHESVADVKAFSDRADGSQPEARVMTRPTGIQEIGRGADLADRIAFRRVVTESGCWEWTGGLRNGYGSLQVDGRPQYVHRLAYELMVGPIAAGLQIDHLCRNTKCHNPDHLEAVTPRVNTRRGFSQGAIALRRVTCLRGHLYSEWGVERMERRICRLCNLARARAYQQLSKSDRAARREAGIPVVDLDAIFGDPNRMAELDLLDISPDDIHDNGRTGIRTAS